MARAPCKLSGNAEERAYLRDIQKLINQKIDVVAEHPFLNGSVEDTPQSQAKPQRSQQQSRSGNSGNGGGYNSRQKRRRPYSRRRR